MAIDIRNFGAPQIVEATFVAQAVEAGILTTIKSLVVYAEDELTLLGKLKDHLSEQQNNPALAEALNRDTLRAILKYMYKVDSSIGYGENIPDLLDEDGPAAIWVAHYAGEDERLVITTPGEEQAKRAQYLGFHLVIDGGIYASMKLPADDTADLVVPVRLLPGDHTAQIVYVNSDRDITRISPPAAFSID